MGFVTRTCRGAGLARILVPGLVALFASPGEAELEHGGPEAASRAASSWIGHAVLVGIADYPGTEYDVECLDDDARDMRKALLRDDLHWTDSNVTLLLDSDATKSNVRSAIESMAAAAGPDDVCVFMFSGHGAKVDSDVPPIDEADGQDELLAPYDALTLVTYIRDDELADWLAGFTTEHVCVIIHACYAGGMVKGFLKGTPEGWAEGFGGDLIAARGAKTPRDMTRTGLVALLSSDDDEYSWATSTLKDSIFVFYLVEALDQRAADADGDGYVSAEEMFAYAAPCVTKWRPDQTPVMYDTHEGELPVALTGSGTLARPVTRADLPLGGAYACAPGSRTGGSAPAGLLVGLLALAASRSNRKRALSIALVCAAVAGCGAGLPSLTAPTSDSLRPLLASSDADVHGAQPQGATEAAKGRRFFLRPGLRAGIVVPVAAEHASYLTAPLVGLYAAAGSRRLQAEAGVEFFALQGEKVEVEAEFMILRLDVLLAIPVSGGTRELYILAGPRYVADYATTYWYSRHPESSLSVGFGAGLRSPAPGWDARLSADLLLDSANIGALVSVLGGFTF